ncbi:MAG TPA: cupin domain-containing protein [Alphaproteobacteria bacterium]|jgi:quercetin dioxygenase-like cupin family protein
MTMMHIALADVLWKEIGPGVERGELRPTKPGAGAALLRFAKGSHTGAHRHPGGEELFVLSGRLRIGDRILEPGAYLYTPPDGINDAEAYEETIVFQYQPEPAELL